MCTKSNVWQVDSTFLFWQKNWSVQTQKKNLYLLSHSMFYRWCRVESFGLLALTQLYLVFYIQGFWKCWSLSLLWDAILFHYITLLDWLIDKMMPSNFRIWSDIFSLTLGLKALNLLKQKCVHVVLSTCLCANLPCCIQKKNYLRKEIVLSGRGLMSVNNVDRTKGACSKSTAGGYKCLHKAHPVTLIKLLLLPDSIFSI